MAFFDFPEEQLRTYTGGAVLPSDFEEFWRTTLDEQLPGDLQIELEKVEIPITAYDVYDLSFLGYDGARIHAWVRVPHADGPQATVVNFLGYSGSRGYPWKDSYYAQAGYVHITMDSRSQGWGTRSFGALSPDPDSTRGQMATPGVMTSGILDRETYYYRRIFIDAIRVLQAALALTWVDPDRLVVAGVSQGGGITLATTALASMAGIRVAGAMPDVPFLCDFPRAVGLTDSYPYREIVDYLSYHPQVTDQAFATLSYFDGVNFARFGTVPALFSTALMDETCPPSSVFAAYNTYAGADKAITVWPWNDHDGGQDHMVYEQLLWLTTHLA